jgi:hypothetical protein
VVDHHRRQRPPRPDPGLEVGLGFVVNRREHIYAIPTDPTVTGLTNVAVPAG